MPKKFLKRFMPDHRVIREHRHLRIFGTLLHDPNLFHLNRRSASGAFANGLFWAFVPMPLQMLPASLFAIAFRVNLPLSIALVWVTNPFTMPPLYYFCYKVGSWLLDVPVQSIEFELSLHWLSTELSRIWEPFLLGCFVVGAISALLGYFGVRGLWRLHLIRHLQHKKRERELRKTFENKP
ncbi:MAG: DUF2062 domain-containing protein [Gammaproteobacteria bacterium HGW-Gammaproteobacteria-1]|jgi:hypothetical protein|nr:MAG: DUF2062 domain-containing protein [Gammaproteobacteria bacterium HGW-Gammaproteobacteria-1]